MNLVQEEQIKEDARETLKRGIEEIGTLGLSELTLYHKPSSQEKKIAQTLQAIWKQELGIEIQLKQLDPKTLCQKLYAKDYELCLSSWIAQVHDPINLLERFKDATSPKNYASWESNTYKKLLELAASENKEFYLEKAQRELENQVPVLALYHWGFPLLVHPRIIAPPTTISGGILLEKTVIPQMLQKAAL